MNKRLVLTGQIIEQLMKSKYMTPLDLANKLGITRSAVYDIKKRKRIKDYDAGRILKALGYTMQQVEKMDDAGLFDSSDTLIESLNDFEEGYSIEFLKMNHNMLQETNITLNEKNKALEAELIQKNKRIDTLIDLLEKAR